MERRAGYRFPAGTHQICQTHIQMLAQQNIQRLWRHIHHMRRKQLALLLVLMIFSSFAEVLSIGAVLPFLGALVDPDRVFSNPDIHPMMEALNINTPGQLVAPLAVAFGFAAVLAGTMRLLLLKASTRLSFAIGAELSVDIYRRTLFQPYSVHISRNSSEVISGILAKTTNVIYGVIIPLLTLISSSIMLIMIAVVLLSLDPVISIAALGGFGAIYAMVIMKTRRRVAAAGHCIAQQSTQVVKAMQEGLGGIRDILIDGSQHAYCEIYRKADAALRHAQETNQYIGQSPRYAIEALGMVLIAGAAYLLTLDPGGKAAAIPILGAFALGAQRLLPVLQQAFASWSSMQGAQASLRDALDLLDQPMPDNADCAPPDPIAYRRRISLRNVSFRYVLDGQWVLRRVDLDISKGSRVGFIGTTGSGKSSLLDIAMGLLQPTEGELAIDGVSIGKHNIRAWQAHIAHVPQTIFLSDATIAENIAFGVPPSLIDHDRVRRAAQQAQIAATIESWSAQYQTQVGERGVRLSGGQRQRIGIARALYKQADVIVFDEATSALDNDTERAVMEAIEGLGDELTIFMVAHRLTTLKNCTQVIELVDGVIQRTGTYPEIVDQQTCTSQNRYNHA